MNNEVLMTAISFRPKDADDLFMILLIYQDIPFEACAEMVNYLALFASSFKAN